MDLLNLQDGRDGAGFLTSTVCATQGCQNTIIFCTIGTQATNVHRAPCMFARSSAGKPSNRQGLRFQATNKCAATIFRRNQANALIWHYLFNMFCGKHGGIKVSWQCYFGPRLFHVMKLTKKWEKGKEISEALRNTISLDAGANLYTNKVVCRVSTLATLDVLFQPNV